MGLTSCKHSHQRVASIALVSPPRQSMTLCAVLSCAQHAGFRLTSSHQCIPLLFFCCCFFYHPAVLSAPDMTHIMLIYDPQPMCNCLNDKTQIRRCHIQSFSLHIVITQGRDEEEGDRELMPSFDPQPRAVVSASPVVSTPLTGRQVSDEIEKMSSVERPIRGQRRGGGLIEQIETRCCLGFPCTPIRG